MSNTNFITEIGCKYEKKMQTLRQEEEQKRKTEVHEIEERKNSHINTLMENHEKAFRDMRNYFNDNIRKNLNVITSLKVWSNIFHTTGSKT